VHDVLETINHQLVAEVSKATVATLMQLASTPSRPKLTQVQSHSPQVSVEWEPLPEQDIREYVVEWGAPGGTARGSMRVTATRATIPDLRPGEEVRVGAVNRRGAPAWDMARVTPGS
jgi:hypothetical protein